MQNLFLGIKNITKFKTVKRIIINPFMAKVLLPLVLRLDNFLRKLITTLSIQYNGGIHPKHDILKYEQWFIDRLDKEDVVLEVGSHTGEMSKKMSPHVKEILAVEIIPKHVKKAISMNSMENIRFLEGDATKMSFPGIEIDAVVLSNVLEHIELRTEFLRNLIANYSWKDNNPKILIRVPMLTRDWLPIFKKRLGIYYLLDSTHYTEYTEEELRSEILGAGLKINSFETRFGEAYLVCSK
ncbi:MAG: hypothetical protein CME70_21430 [Halobacteriovorax sp.]|nr:hypothetical protein [Halobacteriovorax sp.]